jgi:hypothetical protein
MFNTRTISKLQKVQAWLNDPKGKSGDQFRNMSIAEFKKYEEERLTKCRQEGKVMGRKRAQAETSDDDDCAPGSSSRRAKKGKRRAIHSSELDESE